MALEFGVGARPDRERAEQKIPGLPDRIGMRKGSEILDPLAALPAHHHDPWPVLIASDGEVRETLIVAQLDIESGLMLLDQGVFEHQGVDFTIGDNPLDALGLTDHEAGSGK
jgi:hypothetical protein